MPISLTETASLVNDAVFRRRTTAAFVRHAGFLLQRTNTQLQSSHAAFSPDGVRNAAFDIVRSSDREDWATRLAYLICAVPAMTATADDATLETSVQTAFPSLINPAARV